MIKKRSKLGLISVLLFSAILFSSCSTAQTTEAPVGVGGTTAAVLMVNNTFQPTELTIAAGTTVTWTNEDNTTHTVFSGTIDTPNELFAASVSPGETFSYTFDEVGAYPYYCEIHTGMNGTIIVQ